MNLNVMELGKYHAADGPAVFLVLQFELIDVYLELVVFEEIKTEHRLADITHHEPLGKTMALPEA